MKRETHTINAKGKVLGRLATEIAQLLMGKNKLDYVPYKDVGDFVVVENAGDIKITGKKMEQKEYYHHTGYPAGFRKTPLKKVFGRDPGEALKRAVMGMLPKNKLRDKRIKRLKVK